VVRQFRLAPELFESLDAWKYETNRDWFDELTKVAPEGMDDLAGLIVAYFTEDNHYVQEARRLEASVKRFYLPLSLTGISNQGDWLVNVRFKARFLSHVRKAHCGPLLYVDVDSVIHRDPWPYLNGLDCDVAFCAFRDGKARSGTIYLADTPGASHFLGDWVRRIDDNPAAWDQHPLDDIAREQRTINNTTYRVQFLPPSLCWVFDRVGQVSSLCSEVAPIIEHLQASREGKSGPLLERRRERIAALDCQLIAQPAASESDAQECVIRRILLASQRSRRD